MTETQLKRVPVTTESTRSTLNLQILPQIISSIPKTSPKMTINIDFEALNLNRGT
jgi:hypothetical protein